MKLLVIIGAAIMLAGCDSAGRQLEDAKKQYNFVRDNGGSNEQLCVEAGKVRDAALAAKDAEEYKMADLIRSVDCNRLTIDGLTR